MNWTCVYFFLFSILRNFSHSWPLPSLPIHHHMQPYPYPVGPGLLPPQFHHGNSGHHQFSRLTPMASIDHPDPSAEPLPSGLFIPADQVHIYDFANNYPDDGYYDYDDEDMFQEKVKKWRENKVSRVKQGHRSEGNKHSTDHNNNESKNHLEAQTSGTDKVTKIPETRGTSVVFDDEDKTKNEQSSMSRSIEAKKEDVKEIEALAKSQIINGRRSPPKTLPVEVSRHTITAPNGDMTVVTEMVYKNPFKPTPVPVYHHPAYLPSSRDGLYPPTDDPRLLSSLPSVGYGMRSAYLPQPPRTQRHRDLATTPWSDTGNRVLPTPPTPYTLSTRPSHSSSSSINRLTKESTKRTANRVETITKRKEKTDRSFSPTAIAGIIIGSLVFVALLAGAALFIMYRRPAISGPNRLKGTSDWTESSRQGNNVSSGESNQQITGSVNHFTRNQRPVNKASVSNTLNRSIDGLLVVGDWTLVTPRSKYETLSEARSS